MAEVIAEKNTTTTGRPPTSVFCVKMGPNPWALPTAHPTEIVNRVSKCTGKFEGHIQSVKPNMG